jgi:hypothetical protein
MRRRLSGCSFHQQAASIGDQLVALRKTYIGARVYRGPTGRTAQDQHWRSRSDIGRRLSGTAQDQHWSACRIGRRLLRELASRPALVGSARRCLSTFRHRTKSIGDRLVSIRKTNIGQIADVYSAAASNVSLAFSHRTTSQGPTGSTGTASQILLVRLSATHCARPTSISLPMSLSLREATSCSR